MWQRNAALNDRRGGSKGSQSNSSELVVGIEAFAVNVRDEEPSDYAYLISPFSTSITARYPQAFSSLEDRTNSQKMLWLLDGKGPEFGTLDDALEVLKIYEAYLKANEEVVFV